MKIILAHDGTENAMRRKPVNELRHLVDVRLWWLYKRQKISLFCLPE